MQIYNFLDTDLSPTFFKHKHHRFTIWSEPVSAKTRQKSRSYESDHLRIVFFFIYVSDFHERRLPKNFFFKIFFLWARKVNLGNN